MISLLLCRMGFHRLHRYDYANGSLHYCERCEYKHHVPRPRFYVV